ncbi:MAG TPA: adenylosuccinate synthetase, partial [Steroidobacteraceae bacterium]|nr:adenylosuccinate synthetase [Steroidobacteraceae bacterium]
DVLDGLDAINVCVGYRLGGETLSEPPVLTDAFADVTPVYEELPGWKESTIDVTTYSGLPANARRYLERVAELVTTPIDVVSTGPDRGETIVLRHPFD